MFTVPDLPSRTLPLRYLDIKKEPKISVDYCFTHKHWCHILEHLDIWMICGRAYICPENEKEETFETASF